MPTKKTQEERPVFEDDVTAVVTRVRNAFAEVIESLPGHVVRAHEVSKALGIDKKLGWQITNVVYEPDPFLAAQHIPGRSSVKRFVEAAAKQRVQPTVIASTKAAVADFERLIKVHADDRESFEMLATGCAGEAARKSHLNYRKVWCNAGGLIWGVQAKTHLAVSFIRASENGSELDLACLRGFVQLRQIRPDVAWPIQMAKSVTDDGSEPPQPTRESLESIDQTDGDSGAPLLTRFCSQPMPEVRRVSLPDGTIRDELVGRGIGRTGAVDCILGEILRGIGARYRDAHDWEWGVACHVRTPSEALILDQFVHKDLFGPVKPRLEVYNDLMADPRQPSAHRASDRMTMFESVQHLGSGLSGIRTPDIPRYAEMAAYVLDRMGWDADQFDLYRVRIEFPPVPATVVMLIDLPEMPTTHEAGDDPRG